MHSPFQSKMAKAHLIKLDLDNSLVDYLYRNSNRMGKWFIYMRVCVVN